jgi:hypothetical protein
MTRLFLGGMLLAVWAGLQACTTSESGLRTSTVAPLRSGLPADAPTAVTYVSSCNIQRLDNARPPERPLPVQQGATLHVSGVVDEAPRQSPARVVILVQSAANREYWWAPISGELQRQEAAKTRNGTLAGFTATLDLSPLPPGEYLLLTHFWQDGPSQICDNGRRIAITAR